MNPSAAAPVIHEFRTVVGEFRYEIEQIKGSRFLATVANVASVEAAEAFVAKIRTEFAAATHNCWAYRTGIAGEAFRSNDDGEPGGSAGRPILQQIEGHGLTNVAVVVTRWFGGTKLGVGGLMRAYGGAAGKTLDRAPQQIVVIKRRIEVRYPYECSGALDGLLAAHQLAPIEAEYDTSIRLVLEIPERELGAFTSDLMDRTAGRAEIS